MPHARTSADEFVRAGPRSQSRSGAVAGRRGGESHRRLTNHPSADKRSVARSPVVLACATGTWHGMPSVAAIPDPQRSNS